jgi:hypothetical protein
MPILLLLLPHLHAPHSNARFSNKQANRSGCCHLHRSDGGGAAFLSGTRPLGNYYWAAVPFPPAGLGPFAVAFFFAIVPVSPFGQQRLLSSHRLVVDAVAAFPHPTLVGLVPR